MARLLRSARDEEVVARCAVCNSIDCLLRSGVMRPEWRIEWLDGPRRPQDERGTSRKNQVALLERNIRYFHDMVKGSILSLLDVQHLMRFVSMNSQFVQEREKKFIATAMAVAENERAFGYRFQDPQRFVNRMGNFIHGYMMYAIVPHIMDVTNMTDTEWEAHLQKLIDTALPKAPDVIYALMVEANAEQGNFEREPAAPLHDGFDPTKHELPFGEHVQTNGRFAHRVPFGNDALANAFLPDRFLENLEKCVKASPHYELEYASSASNSMNVYEALRVSNTEKGVVKIRRFEIQVAMRALNGPYAYGKRLTTSANGVAELPSSADLQRQTNVHPRMRYHNTWLAFGLDRLEAEDRVAMMLVYHPNRNDVGKEQIRSGVGAKACFTLRMPTISVPLWSSRQPTVRTFKRLDVLTSLSPATFVKLGLQAHQSRASMCQTQGAGSVLTRQIHRNGNISLLGAPSRRPEHKCLATQTYELARDMQTTSLMAESARNIARALDQHQNRRALPGLPLVPLELEYARAAHANDALDFKDRLDTIEATAWERWWQRWEQAPPSQSVRALVKALHDANDALNEFAAERKGQDDYDVAPDAQGMHGQPSVLYANLNVIHDATRGASCVETHAVVQELLSSYHAIRTYSIIFINAYETNEPVPETVTRANVRDFPAHLDPDRSRSVVRAMQKAKTNADELWNSTPAIGITREEFETMGAHRAWAIERKKRARHEEAFQSSGMSTRKSYCIRFNLDYDSTFEDPAVQARQQYAQILKEIANVRCDRRNERLDLASNAVDLARKRRRDALRKEGERKLQARRRVRVAPIPPAPPLDTNEKIARAKSKANAKRLDEHSLIERFANGERVAPLEAKFDEAMRIRYGGLCQQYVSNRHGMDDRCDRLDLANYARGPPPPN